MVVATNLKTSTETVTKEQSKNMLKNAIRTGISAIAYLRNLFEEEAFDESCVSGLQLKTLKPHNSEAKLILDWLNLGVIDALDKEYLRLLVFGIHDEKDDLIECYHFKFKYGDRSNVDVMLRRGSTKPEPIGYKRSPCTKDEAKQQTVQLLRALILLTQSLSPLPELRYISMKLWYYDEKVPKGYEPSLFRPATLEEQLKFSEVPFECSVGKVDTGYHTLSIRVKSTADEDVEYEGLDVDEVDKYFATNGEICAPSQEAMEDAYEEGMNYDTGSTSKSVLENATRNSDSGKMDVEATEAPEGNAHPACDHSTQNESTVFGKEISSLVSDATELAKSAKYLKKETLASGLGINAIVAKPLLDRLIEKGIISSKLVRGKGYESKVYVPRKPRQNKRCREENDEDDENADAGRGTLCYTSEQLTIPTKKPIGSNKTRRSTRRSS